MCAAMCAASITRINNPLNPTLIQMKKKALANTTKAQPEKGDNGFVFGPFNYILMAIGIVVLIIGYALLSGGGSDDPNVFNDAMFDNRRLVAAPLLIVGGFVIEILAIMLSPKRKGKNNGDTPADNC